MFDQNGVTPRAEDDGGDDDDGKQLALEPQKTDEEKKND